MHTASALPGRERTEGEGLRPFSGVRDQALEVVVTGLAVGPETVHACAALLSAPERARARRFSQPRDARRFVVGRAGLRQLVGGRLGIRPECVDLGIGTHGKPMLLGRGADHDLRFNLSRCDDVAVYVLSTGREVGVDVEAVRPIAEAEAIAARCFSPSERAAFQALAPDQRPFGFFHCWTRKEAFVKALGAGLSCPLDSFDVSLTPGVPAALLRVDRGSDDDRSWQMASWVPVPGFVAAVVAEVVA